MYKDSNTLIGSLPPASFPCMSPPTPATHKRGQVSKLEGAVAGSKVNLVVASPSHRHPLNKGLRVHHGRGTPDGCDRTSEEQSQNERQHRNLRAACSTVLGKKMALLQAACLHD